MERYPEEGALERCPTKLQGVEFLSALFSNARTAFLGGAGKLEPRNGGAENYERERLLDTVRFTATVAEGETEHSVSITLSFSVTLEDGEVVTGSYVIPNLQKNEYSARMVGVTSVITRDTLPLLGVSVSACRFFVDDQVSEWRFYVSRNDTGERYIVTLAENDHWQSSHSHPFDVEEYSVLRGTLILVGENPASRSLSVRALSKTEQGYRQVSFNYNPETGMVEDVEVSDHTESPIFRTETDVAHNVYLSADAVIGTEKVIVKNPTDEPAWKGEGGFDDVLNATREDSDGNRGVIHRNIEQTVQWLMSR